MIIMLTATGPAAGQPPAAPQPQTTASAASASSVPAAQLASALEEVAIDAIAAKDSDGEDRYVAALFFPGRLLVVSARYEVPMYVDEKLAAGSYRDVYLDLNSASIAGTKVFITDTGADGLHVGEPGDFANMDGEVLHFEEGSPQFDEVDASYARMLRALVDATP